MSSTRILICIAIMAIVTYLPRVLPMLLFKRRIQNPWIQSFLAYVPYAVISAMTFPHILYSTGGMVSGIFGLLVALWLSYQGRKLLTIIISSVGAVFVCEQVCSIFGFVF